MFLFETLIFSKVKCVLVPLCLLCDTNIECFLTTLIAITADLQLVEKQCLSQCNLR